MEISTSNFDGRGGGVASCAETGAISVTITTDGIRRASSFMRRDRSYNLAVIFRLLSAAAIALLAADAFPAAPQPSLPEVLSRASAYVKRFHNQLSEMVSEETYSQLVYSSARRNDPMTGNISRVALRSDLMLI